jgi:hypothetical protein
MSIRLQQLPNQRYRRQTVREKLDVVGEWLLASQQIKGFAKLIDPCVSSAFSVCWRDFGIVFGRQHIELG